MKKIITFVLFFFFYFTFLEAKEETPSLNTSAYTSIDQNDCMTLDSDNMGSIQVCESFLDIDVKVIEGDLRQSIVLVRKKKEYDLNFLDTISSSFSSLGLRIEWRHELSNPENLKGMIVRFDVSDNYENLDKVTSYLVVSKITEDEMCVVAKVAPQKNQNAVARGILDSNRAFPCLKNFKKQRK